MKHIVWTVIVGRLKLELWMSRHEHFVLVFRRLAEPDHISVTHLGDDPQLAAEVFARKVELHRWMGGHDGQ